VINTEALDRLGAEWQAYDAASGHALVEALNACLAELTPNARRMVELRYLKGMSSGTVAETLGRRKDTVYRTLIRIRKTLGECVRRRTAEEGLAGA